tara:strand:- start:178 stop:1338 length:1161 start_codon:yes stop_codon:yes gene_type:complete
MHNNFIKKDVDQVIKLLKKKNVILTQSKNVKKFEENWSKWLGVKYSVFVNSGSSANLISLDILNILKGKGEVIVPPLTWSSDINAVIKNNMKPVFIDINLENLCMNENKLLKAISNKTKAIFFTHAQGFNGFTNKLIQIIKKKKIFLIEDVCESHGAKFNQKKLGTFGNISNFSFYYAHHMSTIEGGMICTNEKKIYQLARMLRSHGLVREINDNSEKKKLIKKYPKLSPEFIFMHPAYNMRNNEIGGVLGINQLKRLDKNNRIRNKNFKYFIKNLDSSKYFTNFDFSGCSNYAFPLILKKQSFQNRDNVEKILKKNKIEFRRGNAGGGNQLLQPYLMRIKKVKDLKNYKNINHVHHFGYYIGNYPTLKIQRVLKTCKVLNSIKFK